MRLYHPGLDKTIQRSERQARVLQQAGWQPKHDPDDEGSFDVGGEPPAEHQPAPDNEE